jgi:hypothetical protein
MAERAPIRHEHEKAHESSKEQNEKLKETIEAGKQAKHEAKDSLDEIRSSIEKEAAKAADKKQEQASNESKDKGPGRVVIDRNVKKKAYKKELHRIQTHLPKSQRTFSKFIHNNAVETVSEVGGKTVARPSGLLGGGIVAFLGTLGMVLVSRHYGFTYNFFVFVALLVGGFFLGLILELVIRGVLKARS